MNLIPNLEHNGRNRAIVLCCEISLRQSWINQAKKWLPLVETNRIANEHYLLSPQTLQQFLTIESITIANSSKSNFFNKKTKKDRITKSNLPWQVTTIRLPSILEVRAINATIFQAIKFFSNKRTSWRVVKRIWIVDNPTSLVHVTLLIIYGHLIFVALRIFFTKAQRTKLCKNQGDHGYGNEERIWQSSSHEVHLPANVNYNRL